MNFWKKCSKNKRKHEKIDNNERKKRRNMLQGKLKK